MSAIRKIVLQHGSNLSSSPETGEKGLDGNAVDWRLFPDLYTVRLNTGGGIITSKRRRPHDTMTPLRYL